MLLAFYCQNPSIESFKILTAAAVESYTIVKDWHCIDKMADNVVTDDGESELQFVSTKSERLKLSWPIKGWSERTIPARTRRLVGTVIRA